MDKKNVRIFFEKKGRAIYISHLDLMRTMQRALKRSGLPVWFTEGFNPRLYLNFPLALSLGTTGEREPMDIAVVEEIGLDLEAKGIGLSYFNYATADTMIIADPEQLKKVINNIVSNSVKYMDKEEKIIHMQVQESGDFIHVAIEDNGRGIAQKDLPLIFERFYRADAARTSSAGGSGIGLSIVKKIIEDHGGRIWAASREGVGTTLHFELRKYEQPQKE